MQTLRVAGAISLRGPCSQTTRGRQATLRVRAGTLWSLAPRQPSGKQAIDLTGAIGSRRVCSVGAKDYANKSEESIDYTVVEHGGVHLLFEAEGESNPLDSPSILYVTDVDSECEICVEDKPIPKGARTRVKPGACISLGDQVVYQVQRNVFAHA